MFGGMVDKEKQDIKNRIVALENRCYKSEIKANKHEKALEKLNALMRECIKRIEAND